MANSRSEGHRPATLASERKADIDGRRWSALMRRFALAPFRPLDFLDCGHDPLPNGAALHVAPLQHGVGGLGSLQGGARTSSRSSFCSTEIAA